MMTSSKLCLFWENGPAFGCGTVEPAESAQRAAIALQAAYGHTAQALTQEELLRALAKHLPRGEAARITRTAFEEA